MDFLYYKNYLIDYLKKCSPQENYQIGLCRCFSPSHPDHNPSCELFQDHFICYACGIHGDIYDAVEILEGITKKSEQFEHLEKIFGGTYTPSPIAKADVEKKVFTPKKEAIKKLQEYLKEKRNEESIRHFLKQRATISTKGQINSYPEDLIPELVKRFDWWPGVAQAKKDGWTDSDLQDCGLGSLKDGKPWSAWYSAGVVLKLGAGYKLHYYYKDKCEKRGSLGCNTFPMPSDIQEETDLIILVEGEIDAAVCYAAGLKNVFSTGGTNGLTKPKIQKLIPPTVKEVVIMYDNDDAGKKFAGLKSFDSEDKNKQSLPDRLKKAGYLGRISIAELTEYKDPDECILHGRFDIIKNAIDTRIQWTGNVIEEEKPSETEIERGRFALSQVPSLLKRFPKKSLKQEEIQPFVDALINCVNKESEKQVKALLEDWGATPAQLRKKHLTNPHYLVDIAHAYNLSYYYIKKLEDATLTKKILEQERAVAPIAPIDYRLIDNTDDLKTLIYKRGEKAAAAILANVLVDKLIYVETNKKYYSYNGLVWQRESDITGIAYNILHAILFHYLKETDSEDQTRIKAINSGLTKIEEYRFLKTIMQAVADKPQIFREQITFDGPAIQETLTLQDGVVDFSGKEIHYRNARPEEYRRKMLPYSIDQVREEKDPKNFIKFMRGNFRNEDTFNTLMYFLSLLPSRRAQFKVGGIFVGVSNTGKTTTMNIISKIYPEMIAPIPRELIMSTGRFTNSAAGPNPFMARLEGAGAGLSDETQRNDTLNSAMWKQLTGGGMLTARGMYAEPRNFMPTAQIIILTNFSPKFDGKDQATINRMVVVPFNVTHEKGKKGTVEESDLLAGIEPEFPLVVKLFAKYYIDLKFKHKSQIPLSKECEAYKQDYVENQETDLDRFVANNIEFIKDENVWVPLVDIYRRFAQFNQIELDLNDKPINKDEWTQTKFTRYFKGDYNEVRIKQKKINGYPVQVVLNARLKELKLPETKENQVTKSPAEQKKIAPQTEIPFEEFDDDDNPF